MKKRKSKKLKKNFIGKSDAGNSDFAWGLKGLKISLGVLVVIIFFLFVFLIVNKDNLPAISEVLFRSFGKLDYLAVFVGCVLFIAVPFLLGIKVGLALKKKAKE